MNKEQRNTVVEYASTLSEEDLRWLALRLTDRLSGDLAEAVASMSRNFKMDALLQTAESCWGFYDLCDKIRDVLAKECKKRGVPLQWGPRAA